MKWEEAALEDHAMTQPYFNNNSIAVRENLMKNDSRDLF